MGLDPDRTLVLMGMMGAGKSTTGKALASLLGRKFVDTDQEIELRTNMKIAEIFDRHGEKAFRDLEVAVIAEVVRSGETAVLSIGGGAVIDERTQQVLADEASVVWLDASVESLISRATQRPGVRPLLKVDPEGTMRRLASERRPIYERLADETVDVTRVNAKDVAKRIAEMLS